jgi:hypothetical protein
MPGPRFDTWHTLVLVALLCVPAQCPQGIAQVQRVAPSPDREAFYYNVEWRLIDAGKAKLAWTKSSQSSRPGREINLHLESAGLVSKLYKVNDDYTANLNGDLCVENTHIQSNEGSRKRETVVHFDPVTRKASYLERDLAKHAVALSLETDIPVCVHDVIGGLFFLRTRSLEPGRSIEVPVSDGKRTVLAKVEAQQREQIKVPAGTFRAVRYEAFLFNGVLYKRPGHLYVWLSDDARKVPVRIQVRLHFTIGTITFHLEKEDKT